MRDLNGVSPDVDFVFMLVVRHSKKGLVLLAVQTVILKAGKDRKLKHTLPPQKQLPLQLY